MGTNASSISRFLIAVVVCGTVGSSVQADDVPEYNRDIRPILAEYCFACHGPDSAARKADLRLDQRDAAVEAAAISPGNVKDSELISRIFTDDPELVMPPPETKQSLTEADKEKLRAWVESGAEYQKHWSFLVPETPESPPVSNESWVTNDIDRFVLATLEAKGLSPAPEADARTLFRRLHLDITGLPPTPNDVAVFVNDFATDKEVALSAWIDHLMDSPAWGEHRARYWLDAARYADTHGLHFDNYREMWPYRDWVIRAFNANQPFDQFTIEQIAGDLLPDPTEEQLVATGFQRCNITTNEGGTIDEENLANYAVDRVQTFGWVYLGLTTNCSQCHDHKFDAFTMKDYYSLAAFFRNTTQQAKDGNVKDGRGPAIPVPVETDQPRWKAIPGEIAGAKQRREQRRAAAQGDFEAWLATVTTQSPERTDDDGLVLRAPLNEGTGNTVTNNASAERTQFAATGPIEWDPNGKIGTAPVMKAGSTFDLGALGDFEKNQPFSYGAWVRSPNATGGAGIIARMDEPNSFRGWDLWQNAAEFAVHFVDAWPGNAFKIATSQPVVRAGQWQHVFVTYDGSGKPEGVRIYVDGQSQPLRTDVNNLKPDASIRTATPLRVGQRSQGAVFVGGSVQDVRIYRRLLTDAEVAEIRENGPLQTLLAIPAEERTDQQRVALFDQYLSTSDAEFVQLTNTIARLNAERETIRARSPVTHIQQERTDSMPAAFILMRGQYDRPGEKVEANTPSALHPFPEGVPRNRMSLARWLVDPANPLTARVTVNRFWQQVFGRGIVVTPEDFGVMGADPSNPELLDWLAIEFQNSGWNVRHMFKLMLTSATYRQAAVTTPEKMERDRDNAFLSRGPRFRMDAEMVRDYALATSGLLSRTMYGPGTKPYQPEGIWDIVGLPEGNTRIYTPDTGENLYRRTLYHFWKRMAPPPNLEAFNAPSREVCTVQRERTNTPLQALVTLNDPQFVEAARYLAERALGAADGDAHAAIDFIAQHVLCRPMTDREREIVLQSHAELLAHYQANPDDAKSLIEVGESVPNNELNVSELAAWTMVCNQIMNLDEVLNK